MHVRICKIHVSFSRQHVSNNTVQKKHLDLVTITTLNQQAWHEAHNSAFQTSVQEMWLMHDPIFQQKAFRRNCLNSGIFEIQSIAIRSEVNNHLDKVNLSFLCFPGCYCFDCQIRMIRINNSLQMYLKITIFL